VEKGVLMQAIIAGLRVFFAANWQLLLLVAVVFVLWSTPVAYPLRLLVVLFHEVSHALVAIATGGRVIEMTINVHEGGHVRFQGGNLFLTATAGYLGSLAIGLGLLIASVRTTMDRAVLAGLAVVLIVLTALYVRDLFALAFILGTGAVFLAVARFLPAVWSDLVLRVIGLTSMVYVPYDIFSDTLARAHLRSDARVIAETTGIPTVIWGTLWVVISLVAIFWALRMLTAQPTHLFEFGRGSRS